MPKAEAEGVLFIEESVSDAMSDTTLDCKLSKADVSGHIGTGGPERRRWRMIRWPCRGSYPSGEGTLTLP
jgi:hypothetical protein